MTRRIDSLLLGWLLAIMVAFLAVGLTACSDDDDDPVAPIANGCLDCHADQARLTATADPEDEPHDEDPGEG